MSYTLCPVYTMPGSPHYRLSDIRIRTERPPINHHHCLALPEQPLRGAAQLAALALVSERCDLQKQMDLSSKGGQSLMSHASTGMKARYSKCRPRPFSLRLLALDNGAVVPPQLVPRARREGGLDAPANEGMALTRRLVLKPVFVCRLGTAGDRWGPLGTAGVHAGPWGPLGTTGSTEVQA